MVSLSPSSSATDDQQTARDTSDHTLPKRPWRLYRTPWDRIVSHRYPGEGTDDKPYIVDWLPEGADGQGDPENPMTWRDPYKWTVVMSVALATLAVAMASSTL